MMCKPDESFLKCKFHTLYFVQKKIRFIAQLILSILAYFPCLSSFNATEILKEYFYTSMVDSRLTFYIIPELLNRLKIFL